MAYIWIVLGCIFMGAAHDYFSGMLSIRNGGANVPDIIGKYLGGGMKQFILVLSVCLLLVLSASFVSGPADLLAELTSLDKQIWVCVVLGYYILATLLPIDKLIGRFYPVFGALLLFMVLSVGIVMLYKACSGDVKMIELSLSSFKNMHANPETNILFPMMFIVISCGAISGFHSTQSPLMMRCMSDEKYGRPVLYGAMISEGIVAMIWATAAIAYMGGVEGLNEAAVAGKTPAILVNEICQSWLGKFGAILAILGVIICPITSGDTAARSCRLIVADKLKIRQKPIINRILIAIPIFIIISWLCMMQFAVIWQYVGIGNQILASIVLWTGAEYLRKHGKNHWIMSLPATFLTYICVCYIMIAPVNVGGIALNHTLSYVVAGVVALGFMLFFLLAKRAK